MDKTATERKRRQREKNSCDGLFKQVECWAHHDDVPALRELEQTLRNKRLEVNKMSLSTLNEGDIATQNGEYSKVSVCVHGNPYYAEVDVNELSDNDVEGAIEVNDMFEDHLDCCS